MFQKVRQSVRRARNSSSDSETGTPQKQQRTMADNMADISESDPTMQSRNIDDIYGLLKEISKDNKDTRSYLETRLDKFENEMKSMINTSVSSLRSDMNKELSRVDSKIKDLSGKINMLETRNESIPTEHQPGGVGPRSELDTERNLCFKNIVEEDLNDGTEKLCVFVSKILSDLNIDVNVVAVKRIGEKRVENGNTAQQRPRQNRPVIVTMETNEQTHTVLKVKRNLRQHQLYGDIYIEKDKTRHERILEANMRTIVNKIEGLRVRGGRVIKDQ